MLFHLNLTIMTIISVPIQLCLTISFGIHKATCLTDLLTSHLICGDYWLTVFFTVGMSTDRIFWAVYTISCFASLALSLLDFLRLLLIILKYLVYLVFFISFSSTQDCAFPMSRGWVNFGRRDLVVMFTNVTSWSLRLFLNIPFFLWKVLHFQRCRLVWSNIVEQWVFLAIDTLLVN